MCRRLWFLLQVLGQIHLIASQTDSSPANKTIRIGYVLQFSYLAGAINVAIEQAQNDGLLRGYNIRYNYTNSVCVYFLQHGTLQSDVIPYIARLMLDSNHPVSPLVAYNRAYLPSSKVLRNN